MAMMSDMDVALQTVADSLFIDNGRADEYFYIKGTPANGYESGRMTNSEIVSLAHDLNSHLIDFPDGDVSAELLHLAISILTGEGEIFIALRVTDRYNWFDYISLAFHYNVEHDALYEMSCFIVT